MTAARSQALAATLAEARAALDSGAPTVDVNVAAALLGCCPFTLYAAVKRGDAPITPIRVGRRQRYRVADLRKLLGLDG